MRAVFRIYFWAFLSLFDSCVVKNSQDRGKEVAGENTQQRAAGQIHTQLFLHFDARVKPDPQISTNERSPSKRVLLNCFILALCNSPERALTLACIQKVYACHLFHILPLQPYSKMD